LFATASTEVILIMFPASAKGIEDKIIVSFIKIPPSRINAYITAMVKSDIIEFNPLHGSPTSKEPAGIFRTMPSLSTGIPNMFDIVEEPTADKVCIGGAMISTIGKGIINNKKMRGKLIFFMNSQPNKYNIMPEHVTKRDMPDMNLILQSTPMP
jgi:hypothetical protein